VKRPGFGLVAIVLVAVPAALYAAEGIELKPGTKVEFASAADGARLLTEKDVFVQAMSPFDRSARLKTDKLVSEEEYLAFVGRQTREWTADEKARVVPILESFRRKSSDLKLRFPTTIRLVKTSGLEEGNAAYCRGATIVLPERLVDGDPAELENIIFHELFHVYRTSNPSARSGLYAIIGFQVSPEIPLPAELQPRKITNPDAPLIDSYIEVRSGASTIPVTPVLFSHSNRYDTNAGGEFFDSMVFRLMVLEKTKDGFRPTMRAEGGPDLRDPSELPDYLEQIGKNTPYIIHPEEILADNFVLLINRAPEVPSPNILQKMRTFLTR